MKKFFVLLILLNLAACSSKEFDSSDALWEFIKNKKHGYLLEKNVNGYDFSLLYKPTDLLVQQELGEGTSEQKIKELREKYKKQLYFTLSMSRNGKELLSTTPKNRQEFGAMVNQLAFGMREKITVFTPQKDTLEMLDYNYPRMYGMSRATTMLLVYPRNQDFLQDDYVNLTIQDLDTYTGEVKFKIATENINNEPTLKF